jgi:hypothetical protein
MPYIVVSTHKEEVDRRELIGPMVIGRSAGCDLCLHDILLSRRHLRIEPARGGWVAIDLESKNGTTINGKPLKRQTLIDGDCLRVGRAKVTFFAASILSEDDPAPSRRPARPVDPHESLAGTAAIGFEMLEAGESPAAEFEGAPRPMPHPKAPVAYEREELYSMLTAIASSSWDSIYAEARRPIHANRLAELSTELPRRIKARPASPVDLSLQACSRRDVPSLATLLRRKIKSRLRLVAIALWGATAGVFAANMLLGNSPSRAAGAQPNIVDNKPVDVRQGGAGTKGASPAQSAAGAIDAMNQIVISGDAGRRIGAAIKAMAPVLW